jgi:hypothetical protein
LLLPANAVDYAKSLLINRPYSYGDSSGLTPVFPFHLFDKNLKYKAIKYPFSTAYKIECLG